MNRQVDIFYAFFENRWTDAVLQCRLQVFPPALQERILRYKRWQDRQLACLGKILLREALQRHGFASDALDHLHCTAAGRPFVKAPLDFNISHSGECAVCAVVTGGRVGIDIEKIESLSWKDLLFCMTGEERERILTSPLPAETFLGYWTAKESLAKLLGTGIATEMRTILVDKDSGRLDDEPLFVKEIFISSGYKMVVATDFEAANIVMHHRKA